MKYVIANWKMNLNMSEIIDWANGFSIRGIPTETKVILAPSFPHLFPVKSLFKNTQIEIASQDVSLNEKGAHTGEVGAFQLKDVCKFAIIGHSERNESSKVVALKIGKCLVEGITPIVCFVTQETLTEYKQQGPIYVWEDPANISKGGKYVQKDPSEIETEINHFRSILGDETPLIYGGSVNRQNIGDLGKIGQLNGVLIGNASLDPKHFSEIINNYK